MSKLGKSVKETSGMYKQLTSNCPHGDVVSSILDVLGLSVDCVCHPELSSIFVDIDPGGWV